MLAPPTEVDERSTHPSQKLLFVFFDKMVQLKKRESVCLRRTKIQRHQSFDG